jgi:hypothetical protein
MRRVSADKQIVRINLSNEQNEIWTKANDAGNWVISLSTQKNSCSNGEQSKNREFGSGYGYRDGGGAGG